MDDLIEACGLGGYEPFDWQVNVLAPWLGRDAAGRWSAPTCGLSIPRQNGKTLGVIEPRAVYGMLVLGERVIYTAQLQKTATELFEAMADLFERRRMRRYLRVIKTALGREQIILRNGARIKYLARTRNGGNGQHGDLLIFDEAQELDPESQASFLPAISASPNPQVVYAGTPPGDLAAGAVFAQIRASALDGASQRTAWAEWSVPEIGDPADESRYPLANPSYGITIQLPTIQAEAEQMPADKFARERLGWWRPAGAGAEPLIGSDAWAACLTDDPQTAGKLAYGVKFSPDGKRVALSAALAERGGPAHVELIELAPTHRGTGWLRDWIARRRDRCAACVIDGKAGASNLAAALVDAGMTKRAVIDCSTAQVVAASSMLVEEVRAKTLTHIASEAMDDSAIKSVKRTIGGNGGYGFGDGPESISAPIESAALALWGARTTKRDPSRKQVVW